MSRINNLKKSKKAAIEIQFNWIYIAIAGGIILLLFLNIAAGIRKSSKEQLEYEAINYFDKIFTSMQSSENTENSITLPGMEIEVETAKTDIGQCNYYKISKSTKEGQEIKYLPIFSPDIIKKKVLSYSIGWDMPFRVNYFLYLTSPDVAYVFVNDVYNIEDDMPDHLTKRSVDSTYDFINQNYYKIRYVAFNEDPNNFQLGSSVKKLKDNDVTLVNIIPETDIYGFGKIVFYGKKSSSLEEKGTTYYLDEATLFAAIYSNSYESYQCNMMKSFERLNKLSSLLKERVEVIGNSELVSYCNAHPDRCKCTSDIYTRASSILNNLQQSTSSFIIQDTSIKNLETIKRDLASLNDEINKKSCPTVY